MATPKLTPEVQSKIREGHAAGRSLNSIAKELDINPSNVSRWAKREGLIWSGTPHASTVVRERLAYNRLLLAEAALADALAIRERLWDKHEVVVSSPAGPQRVTLDLPDAKATAEYAAAVERLVKTHSVMSDFAGGSLVDHAKSTLDLLMTQMTQWAERDIAENGDPFAGDPHSHAGREV
ncbi:hypothetical protein [Rhodococcus sp. NPDC127528]|uniref:hypothetical protein n=1 Tax=unclassified Rhodococcus (in: high G+C Gram-positive bacteria) TaxID=192944 RepID=UPI003645B800